eukprot:13789985-Ditylum_brightwellii.AAC.1
MNPEVMEITKEDLFSNFMAVVKSEAVQAATKRTTKILDAKYEMADLEKLVMEECPHLNKWEMELLLALLRDYETLFDGTLGNFKTSPVSLE